MNKHTISNEFNDFALDYWRNESLKIMRIKECQFLSINKRSFIIFSIRWLFQVADVLIKLEKYEEAEEVYDEVGIICKPDIPDYDCFKQALFCRKDSLEFLRKYGKKKESIELSRYKNDLSFEEFMKHKGIVIDSREKTPTASSSRLAITPPTTGASQMPVESTPSLTSLRPPLTSSTAMSTKKTPARKPATSAALKTPRPKKPPPQDESVIYIDSSDDEGKSKKAKPKKDLKPAAPTITLTTTTTRSTRKATSSKSTVDLTQSTSSTSSSSRTRRMI